MTTTRIVVHFVRRRVGDSRHHWSTAGRSNRSRTTRSCLSLSQTVYTLAVIHRPCRISVATVTRFFDHIMFLSAHSFYVEHAV